jgi:hypothetical protein
MNVKTSPIRSGPVARNPARPTNNPLAQILTRAQKKQID